MYNQKRLEKYHQQKVIRNQHTAGTISVTPEAVELEKRAVAREKRGQYRVAANLWLQCLDKAHGEVERARIAFRRQLCITRGNGLRRGEYSGVYNGGVVYD